MAKFQPGQSGNPSGRPKMDPRVKAVVESNGTKAVERLRDMLAMDELFHRIGENGKLMKGALSGKEQIQLLVLAQDRAFGKAESISVSHQHQGQVGLSATNSANRLKQISEQLPERKAQQRAIDQNIIDLEVEKDVEVRS